MWSRTMAKVKMLVTFALTMTGWSLVFAIGWQTNSYPALGVRFSPSDYENSWNFYREQPCCGSYAKTKHHFRHHKGKFLSILSFEIGLATVKVCLMVVKFIWHLSSSCVKDRIDHRFKIDCLIHQISSYNY